ncbi:E3 ubiquitin-protein ligase RBBP6-like [Pomacea canaliculata]|uniref:E3 ubiquitin-protein ligase RBBP6-like n=1 Tax=Pomacea canaliculata TaxID=400727 RepID=UPI000D735476|nr:E3 ubiquitin-protein ligase RBBP6-like [Pomacea canaliculata]
MSCVHYKFKSSLEYQTVTFDGLHISVGDLKKEIANQKRMRPGDFELEITNAQTGEVYKNNNTLIPKNASVIVFRVPVSLCSASSTQKSWEAYKQEVAKAREQERQMNQEQLKQTPDLASASGSEIDKVMAALHQSNKGFEPSNYVGKHHTGPVPESYVCRKCNQPGHHITTCPHRGEILEPRIKRTTGIPASFLTYVDDPLAPGALLTHRGQFAVPTIDAMAYKEGKKERPPFLPQPVAQEPEKPKIPRELKCQLCQDLMTDAVVIPCCGNSYCDECIRTALLETEDHRCPTCHQRGVSPNGIIPNNSLRSAVQAFTNDSGYSKTRRLSAENPVSHSSQPPTPTSHGAPRLTHLGRGDHSMPTQDAQHHPPHDQQHLPPHEQQLHPSHEQHHLSAHDQIHDQRHHHRARDQRHPRQDRLLSEQHRSQSHQNARSHLPEHGSSSGHQIQALTVAHGAASQPPPSPIHPTRQPLPQLSVRTSLPQAPPVYVSSTLTTTSTAGYSPQSLHSPGAGTGYEDDGLEQGIPVLGKPTSKGRGIARGSHMHPADAAHYPGVQPVAAVAPGVPTVAYATPPPGYPAYSVPPPGYAYPSGIPSVYAASTYPAYPGMAMSVIPVSGEDSSKSKPKPRDIFEDFAKDLIEKGRERPFKLSRSRSRSRSYTPRDSRRWSRGRSWSSRSRSRSYKSRSRSRSPRRPRSRSRLRSLSRGRSHTPLRRSRTRSVSIGRGKSRSREKSRSPPRDRSRSQESGRYRSRTPDSGSRYRSSIKGKSRSPSGSKFRSPRRGTSRSPMRGTPRSASRGRSKSWSRSPRGRSRSRSRSFTPKRRNRSFSPSPRSPRRKPSRSLSHSRSRSWSSPRPRSKSFSPQRIKSPLRPKPFRRSSSPYQNRSLSPSYRINGPSPPPVRGMLRGRGRARGRGRRGDWVPPPFRPYGGDRGHRMMHPAARFPVPYHNMLPEDYYRQTAQYEQYYHDYYAKYGPNAPPPQPPPWAPNYGPMHVLPAPAGGWQPQMPPHQPQPHRPPPPQLQSQIQQRPPPQQHLSPLKERPSSQEKEKRRSATPEPPGVEKQPGGQPGSTEDRKDFHRDQGRDFSKETNQEQGRDFTREPGREQGRDHPRDQNREYSREHGRDYLREQNRDYHREQGRDYHREPGRDMGREPGRDFPREPGRDYPRDMGRDYNREPGREGAKEYNRDYGKDYYRDANHRDYRRELARDFNRDYGRDQGRDYARDQGREYYKESGKDLPRERDYHGRVESREYSKERERLEKDRSSEDRKKKIVDKHSKKESKEKKVKKKMDKSTEDKESVAIKKKSATKHASSSDEKGPAEKKIKKTSVAEGAEKPAVVRKKVVSGKVKKIKAAASENKQGASSVSEVPVSKNLIQIPIGALAESGENAQPKTELDGMGTITQTQKLDMAAEKAAPKKVVKRIKKLKVSESKTESSSASESEKTKIKIPAKVGGDNPVTKAKISDQVSENISQDVIVEKKLPAVKKEEKTEVGQESVFEVAAEEKAEDFASIKKEDLSRDELLLPPPEPSKWEQEDFDWSSSDAQNLRKRPLQAEKKTFLPRSVLNRAEKYITQKPVRPAVAPVVSRASPSKRRVYVEENESHKREDKDERKVKTNRSSSLDMQITITKSERRSPDHEGHSVKAEARRLHHEESHRTVVRAGDESGHEKSSSRRRVSEETSKKRSSSPRRDRQSDGKTSTEDSGSDGSPVQLKPFIQHAPVS